MLPRLMSPGDRAPNFALPDGTGEFRMLYNEVSGGPIVLYFFDNCSAGSQVEALQKLADPRLAEHNVHVFGVCVDKVESVAALSETIGNGTLLLADLKGAISQGYLKAAGVRAPAAFVLDPNQRVIAIACGSEPIEQAIEEVAALDLEGPGRLIGGMAPVLIVPNLLSPGFCGRLMETWDVGGHSEGTVEASTAAAGHHRNYGTKRRLDHFIEDPSLVRELAQALGPRIAPEVQKAFFFEDFTFEQFRVGCYEADNAGFFKVHRDNVIGSVRNRRYAVSINLNTGEYDGGDLRFPEYGPDLYRAPRGGGVLFSCSLLHEVVPVTAGRRFVLLSHLLTTKPGATDPSAI